ncbi:MAG: MFS transporter, partial [Halanaerobiales bacterium]|nr:MFS transporter [Halanaerobiales bacterium]
MECLSSNNDFYVALIPPILFLFAEIMSLSLAEQALIAAVITSSGAFAQPVIGYFVDKRGKPWFLIASVLWIAFWMSISGLISNYYLLIIVTGLGALASALYHPLGSTMAASLGNGTKGQSLAIFMTVGGLASSVAPLVAIPLVKNYGLSHLVYLMIPGFFVAGLMYISQTHKIEFKNEVVKKERRSRKLSFYTIKWVVVLVFIATTRFVITRALMSFGIQILTLKEIDIKIASIILFSFLFLSSMSTLIGGYLSDKLGSKKVFMTANFLLVLSLIMLVWGKGIIVILGFVLIGFSVSSANSANIVMTQELIPQNVTFATGLIMGLAGGLAGLGIIFYGQLADVYGLISATTLWIIPLVLVNVLTVFLPNLDNK